MSLPEFTFDQLQELRQCVSLWIRTLEKNGKRPPSAADADHSSLLLRLFRGKPLLPDPPPVKYGYPNYEAVEGPLADSTQRPLNLGP